jgi:hypothetical protein
MLLKTIEQVCHECLITAAIQITYSETGLRCMYWITLNSNSFLVSNALQETVHTEIPLSSAHKRT